ncbi:MAG: 5-bromo-4-chloroindolyl phosphate hydrolysis family protein [Candidatus Faecalibacterium intestinavium]|uniref:5-bromo-4-chloroindolyl phosphate hydrolysis family protein n=1 Tax=Candidatus Faecalibacterium intestinavium TaxID=2838580 RepID=A0A9E2KJG8_9FIRM|nr:5-bromo-4-chloroindolyl phosphate hydrolysis family protein [Candidatus Faecalibacterium intestinavium]
MKKEEQEGKASCANEGAEVQKELERQLRAFGVTVSDAVQHGFEGRSKELEDRARGVGRAVVNAVGFGLSEAGKALNLDGAGENDSKSKGPAPYDYSASYTGGAEQPRQTSRAEMPGWARTILEPGFVPEPETALRSSARKRFGEGLAMALIGGLMAFGFFLGGISCLATMEFFLDGSVGQIALAFTGIGLMVVGALFTAMAAQGGERLEAYGQLSRCANALRTVEVSGGVPLDVLAGLTQQKKKKLRKTLRKLIRKGWMTAWLDEKTDCIFFRAEDYHSARNIPTRPEAEPETAEKEEGASAPLNLEAARRFAQVLAEEKKIMQDPQAAEELERMHGVTQSICDWLEAHPESLPKVRRFEEYYVPTTLKLLHTYNDVQGQRGEAAENIRRDIAGILHTLNTAYDNLYDKLLSDVALDVSSEIAALEGMLAQDGLTGEGFV